MLANKFKYRLTVVPCKYCRSTDIELYEDKEKEDKITNKFSSGGAICQVCKNEIVFSNLPQVPSMSMLLNEWNNYNAI